MVRGDATVLPLIWGRTRTPLTLQCVGDHLETAAARVEAPTRSVSWKLLRVPALHESKQTNSYRS
jgi:hypothetical protein